jgi:hypothetical protein
MENSGEPISFRVPPKMFKDIQKRASAEYITISQWLRKLIREALAKDGKTK